jgi:exonuclease, DNA polymerase III, epsilon subunit family
VFDIETTGLSIIDDAIIEISAIKLKAQQTLERFDTFIKSPTPLSAFTTELTSITDEDLAKAPDISEALRSFKAFVGDAVLVAHNAPFDVDFFTAHMRRHGLLDRAYDAVDTLQMARQLYGQKLKRFNLKAVSKFFNVELTQNHRAEADTFATAEIFKSMLADLHGKGIKTMDALKVAATLYPGASAMRHARKSHVTVWVKNQAGLKHLYQLISDGHTTFFNQGPVVPFSHLNKLRKGLLLGSGCMHSDFMEVALNKDEAHLERVMARYDVIELQPPKDYLHLFDRELAAGLDEKDVLVKVHAMMNRVVRIASDLNIPVIATSDAHHMKR